MLAGKWQCKDFQDSGVGVECYCLLLDKYNMMMNDTSYLEVINKHFFNLFFCIRSESSQTGIGEMQ